MEQEDYIKRQIDQLGRVLGKILADLTGLRTLGLTGEGIEAADQALKAELGLNICDLNSIPAQIFMKTLLEGRKLTNDSFEKLADLFFLLAEELGHGNPKSEIGRKLYERSLIIYEYLDKTSSTYSFGRHVRIEKIKALHL